MSNRIKAFISIALAVLVFVGTVPAAVAEEGYLAENEISTETDVDNSGEVNPENPDVDPDVDPDKPNVDPDDPNVEPDDPDVDPDNPNVDPNPEPDPDPNPDPNPDPEPEPEPDPKPDPKPTDVVGEIWLCSINGSGLAVGHMWVYILNTSDEYLKIGLYDVPPGEGISVGTYGFTRYDGMGVYYNLEARRNDNYCGESYMRLKDPLTRKEAENVTNSILSANYWDPIFNCTTFACRIWNRASGTPMIPMVLPGLTRLQMLIWGADDSDKMMFQPPENCYKQRGTGGRAYMEHCCQKTLDA